MKKVILYNVLSHYGKDGLLEEVRAAIANGWQPFGGIATSSFEERDIQTNAYVVKMTYSQAMVKYEP